jgi:hypothetical protein
VTLNCMNSPEVVKGGADVRNLTLLCCGWIARLA